MKIVYQYWNTTHSWHLFLMENERICILTLSSKTEKGLLKLIINLSFDYNVSEVKKLKSSDNFCCIFKKIN